MSEKSNAWREPASIPEPPLSQFLFADTRLSPLWLLLRVWLGWAWLRAGLGKVTSPAWVGENAGAAVSGYLRGVLARAEAGTADVPGWYVWFIETIALPNAVVFGWLVAWGEVLVGLGLILGMLTGIAAFFGTLMNLSFLFAGTVSTNPMMFIVGTWLVLAWRNSGWYGLDRWVLPALGTPWKRGYLFEKEKDRQ